jgi:hypothetical protein
LFIAFKNQRKVFSAANHCFEVEKEPLKSQASAANVTFGNKKEPPKSQASGGKCDFWKQEGATESA